MGWGINNNASQNGTLSTQVKNVTKLGNKLASDTNTTISSTKETFTRVTSLNAKDTQETWDAVSSASQKYLQDKLDYIRSLWTTKEEVTVRALINEVAPYAMNFEKIPDLIESKITDVIAMLVGVQIDGTSDNKWNDLGMSMLNDYTSTLTSDETINQLNIVKTAGSTIHTVTNIAKTIQSVMRVIEAIKPGAEIVWAFCTMWGVGCVAGAQKSSALAERAIDVAKKLTLATMEKFVFGIKIKVPIVLLGLSRTLNMREALSSYSLDENTLAWLEMTFDDNFLEALSNTNGFSNFYSSLETAFSSVTDWANNNSNSLQVYNNLTNNSYVNGAGSLATDPGLKNRFLAIFDATFLNNAVSNARTRVNLILIAEDEWIITSSSETSDKSKSDKASSIIQFANSNGNETRNYLAYIIKATSKEIYDYMDRY